MHSHQQIIAVALQRPDREGFADQSGFSGVHGGSCKVNGTDRARGAKPDHACGKPLGLHTGD